MTFDEVVETEIGLALLGTHLSKVRPQQIDVQAVDRGDLPRPDHVSPARRELVALQADEVVEDRTVEGAIGVLRERAAGDADQHRDRVVDPSARDQERVALAREWVDRRSRCAVARAAEEMMGVEERGVAEADLAVDKPGRTPFEAIGPGKGEAHRGAPRVEMALCDTHERRLDHRLAPQALQRLVADEPKKP